MLRERLHAALKGASETGDQRAACTLRLILAAIKERDHCARDAGQENGIGDASIVEMLTGMVRQRKDEICRCESGGRLEAAAQEEDEIRVIHDFLPPQMPEAEIDRVVQAAIDELGASRIKDSGRVLAALKARYNGQMNMACAKKLVLDRLN